ncbi:WD40 repeat domain-containing protein [Catellatospora methionotrophica]|uniref:WD40 repeat domain-containing protein n=1 Tax=Catellatospora methionotrophica TaxID=121620 RepID=UPI0033E62D8A
MDEIADPRIEFAVRLQALREAAGLSVRQLVIESAQTPRRRDEPAIRLKRSTIAGMMSLTRPVRPEPANFEVFVDTCLRVAAIQDRPLPPELADRQAWDDAYRQLRDHVDRHPRATGGYTVAAARLPARPARREEPPHLERPLPQEDADPADPVAGPSGRTGRAAFRTAGLVPTRRQVLLATPLVLAGAAIPLVLRATLGSPTPQGRPTTIDTGAAPPAGDPAYESRGVLLSPPIAADNPVWSVAVGMVAGEPVALVGRADGTVQRWDPVTRTARGIPLTGHRKPVYSIALSPPLAVSVSVDGTMRIWDLTADPMTSVQAGETLAGGINSVGVGRVGDVLVAVSGGDDRTVRTWTPDTPSEPGTVLGEQLDAEVNSVAVGTLHGVTVAVSGGRDGTVRLWDLTARRAVQLLGSHQAAVWAMAIGTVNGRTTAVSGSEDGEIRSWDLTAPTPGGRSLTRGTVAVKTIAIGTLDGRTVAVCGSDDSRIRVWDLATGQPYGAGLTGPQTAAEAIAVGDLDGRTVVVSGHWDGSIWTWRM